MLPNRGHAEQPGLLAAQQEPLRSYEQVVVEENLKVGADDRQQTGSEHSLSRGACSSSQQSSSYQQVVVEENCDSSIEARHLSPAERQSTNRPQSYENVVLRQKSQNSQQQTSGSGPLRSYEDIVVEEKSQPDSEGGDLRAKQEDFGRNGREKSDSLLQTDSTANSLSTDEGDDVQKRTATLNAAGQNITQVAEDRTDNASEILLTGNGRHCHVYTKLTDAKNSVSTHKAQEIEPPSDQPNPPVEKHSEPGLISSKAEEGSGDLLRKPLKESSPKGSPSGSSPTPPPVRPKPRKRITLLRQSLVTEEDPKEQNPPAATTEGRESYHSNDSASQFEASDSPVQEALYQEIDELEQPHLKVIESSSSCASGSSLGPGCAGNSPGSTEENQNREQNCASGGEELKLAHGNVKGDDEKGLVEDGVESSQKVRARASAAPKDSGGKSPKAEVAARQAVEGGKSCDQQGAVDVTRKSPETHNPITLQDVEETSFMLKEIEQLLNVRLTSGEAAADSKVAEVSDTLSTSQTESSPVRPPRPKRMDKLRKLSIGSVDSSSTESLTSTGQSGKKAPPKPRRKHLPGLMSRSVSDVTGMKSYVDKLNDNEEEEETEKPSLPPRQQSLCLSSEPKPPPLPPRNKSMEQGVGDQAASSPKLSECQIGEERKPADHRLSAPNVRGAAPTKVVRSSTSGGRPGRKHIPRPTRKAPPPPPHPPNRPLTMSTPQSSNTSETSSICSSQKVPGYQKITNGSVSACDDINIVVPKLAVVGSIDSPCAADVSTDHDYHEIPDHLVKDLEEKDTGQQEPTKPVEGTPPPDLPPRSYNPSSSPSENPTSSPSEPASEKSSDPLKEEDSEIEVETPQDKASEQLSAEDSTSQSSQLSSRPESFCSEVLGSLLHVVGDQHRPVSMHSSSSHSETGSGEVEVPTFDHSSASESENEDDEDKVVCIFLFFCFLLLGEFYEKQI